MGFLVLMVILFWILSPVFIYLLFKEFKKISKAPGNIHSEVNLVNTLPL